MTQMIFFFLDLLLKLFMTQMIFFPELVIKIIQTREKSWEKKKEISFF